MEHASSDAVRASAANSVIDRAHGRAAQAVRVGGSGGEATGGLRYFMYDEQGNTVLATDPTGNVTDSYSYQLLGAWGWPIVTDGDTMGPHPFLFVGRKGYYYDLEGMDSSSWPVAAFVPLYVRGRFYIPGWGRWLNSDPAGILGGDPNYYRYAANNPLNLADPSGLACVSISRNSRINIESQTLARFTVGLLPVIVKYTWIGEYSGKTRTCDICCPGGSPGVQKEVSANIRGAYQLRITGGVDTTLNWYDWKVAVWAGIQGQFNVNLTGSGTKQCTTCAGDSCHFQICLEYKPELLARVGGEARIQTQWWSWAVGLQGYVSGSGQCKTCIDCDESGCGLPGLPVCTWRWEAGVEICFGPCIRWSYSSDGGSDARPN